MTGSTGGGGGYYGGGGYGGGYGGYGDNEPSEAEKELIDAQKKLLELQTGILSEQRDLLKTFMPFIAEQSGFTIEYGTNGEIKGLTESQSPDAVMRRELNSGLLEQSLKALKGELPVSPILETALTRQEEQLRERLAQQFGPGYETSSPGIESLQEFQTGAEGIREDVRRGLLTQSEQLSQARGATQVGNLGNVTNTALGAPLNIAQLFGGVAAGYAQAQQPYTQSRLVAQQIAGQQSIAAMNNQAALQAQQGGFSSLLPLLLLGGGGGLSFSDERYKTDIHDTGEDLPNSDIPIKTWRYKTDPKGTTRVGPMAQDVAEEVPSAVARDKDGKMYIRNMTLGEALGGVRREHDEANARSSDAFIRNLTLGEALKGAY
jgi:hypothetical protein